MKRKSSTTKRLVLRPFRLSDYAVWRAAQLSRLPKQTPYDRGPAKPQQATLAIFRRMLARHERLAEQDDTYFYPVFLRAGGELVGGIDFQVLFRSVYQMANFGYALHNAYWGRGLGKEAAEAGLRIGFSELELHRLEAAINLDNPRSLALARAIGMRREGIRKRYLFEDGKWTDNVVFSLNPEDLGLEAQQPSTTIRRQPAARARRSR